MTTATDLATLIGNAYSSSARSAAIAAANSNLGTTDGDSDGDDMATAKYAERILINRKKHEKGETDFLDLLTDEIMNLLTKDTVSINYNIIKYQQPSKHWSIP